MGTLAELELLASVYQPRAFSEVKARERIERYCSEIVDSVGPGEFAIHSTRRQLQRYRDAWHHARWDAMARAGIKALSPDG